MSIRSTLRRVDRDTFRTFVAANAAREFEARDDASGRAVKLAYDPSGNLVARAEYGERVSRARYLVKAAHSLLIAAALAGSISTAKAAPVASEVESHSWTVGDTAPAECRADVSFRDDGVYYARLRQPSGELTGWHGPYRTEDSAIRDLLTRYGHGC